MKGSKLTNAKRNSLIGFSFTIPWVIGFIFLFLIPLIKTVLYSFSSISIGKSGFELSFVGVRNYRATFSEDPNNLRMVLTSIGNVVVTVIVVVVFSLFLAILLNQDFRGRSLARVIFALPIIIASGVVIVLLKENVLQQNMGSSDTAATLFQGNGLLDFLKLMGLPDNIVGMFENILNNIFDMVWRSGMQIILFLSALQSIPSSSYEAAKIEGRYRLGKLLVCNLSYDKPVFTCKHCLHNNRYLHRFTNTVRVKFSALFRGLSMKRPRRFQ